MWRNIQLMPSLNPRHTSGAECLRERFFQVQGLIEAGGVNSPGVVQEDDVYRVPRARVPARGRSQPASSPRSIGHPVAGDHEIALLR